MRTLIENCRKKISNNVSNHEELDTSEKIHYSKKWNSDKKKIFIFLGLSTAFEILLYVLFIIYNLLTWIRNEVISNLREVSVVFLFIMLEILLIVTVLLLLTYIKEFDIYQMNFYSRKEFLVDFLFFYLEEPSQNKKNNGSNGIILSTGMFTLFLILVLILSI